MIFRYTPTLALASLFTNANALQYGISQLNIPNQVGMIGIYTDSIDAGSQASDINTSCVTRTRTKIQDIRNAKIGGSSKSGRGRFGPFHHNASGAVTGTAGPIIIGGSSGWLRGTSYYTSMFWEDLSHPGSVTPGAGTNYCGCYMAMSQVGLTGNAARWLGLIFDSGQTGVFRIQFRQGASVVQTGTTGTNRYLINGGVPDPAVGGADIKFDITIDPTTASYPDMGGFITGHLNATTMDPTAVWQLVIYRTTNAATNVSIKGFDAHYDEYSAQNVPSIYGATCIMDMARPGKTSEIFQSGASIYGTNADWEAQGVPDLHISMHTKPYNKTALFTHTMPTLKLALTNFWRNDILNVETIAGMNATLFGTRMRKSIMAFAKEGVPLVWLWDIGASAAYTCSFPHFDTAGTQNANDYLTQSVLAVKTCAGYAMTSKCGGGGSIFRIDLACGNGGPRTYAERGFYSTGDYLHLNDAGQEWRSDILAQLVTNPSAIPAYSMNKSTLMYEPRSLTTRLGISKTTLLEIDPDKYGSVRLQGGAGFYAAKRIHTDFGQIISGIGNVPYDGTGITNFQFGQSKRGGAATIVYNLGQFNKRAGLQFDNEALGLSKIEFDIGAANMALAGLQTISETAVTIFFIIQNERQTDISAGIGHHYYWMFGSAADQASNPTSIFDNLGTGSHLRCGSYNGNSGQYVVRVGSALCFMGTNQPSPGGAMPARNPMLGCITIDTVSRTIRTITNPGELASTGWRSYFSDTTLASPWAPTRMSLGGLLGSGNTSAPCAIGGMWVIRGVVTDAEYTAIWNAIEAESGGFFQQGYDFSNFGAAGLVQV